MAKDGDMKGTSNKRLVPELRFSEFEKEGEWEGYKLEDIADFYKGKGISKDDVSYKGKTPCIRYGELYTCYKEIIRDIKSYTNIPIDKLFLSKANDIIIPSSGETKEDISTASCILCDNIALGGDINIIRTSNHNGIFMSYYLNTAKKHDIANIAQGVSIIHLHNKQLQKLYVIIPSFSEQQKIAECLSSIDEEISAMKEQVEQLKAHKKGLMQQLFPVAGKFVPELRFPEFKKDEEWEDKRLEDLCKIGNGKDYKHLNKGCIPVYGSGGYMTSVDSFLYDGDSVCIGRKGTIDRPIFLTGKFWTVDTLFYTHSFCCCLPKFLYCFFQQINWYIYNEAGGVPSLSKKTIEKIKIPFPSPAEQQKIAECLSSIDELISLYENKMTLQEQHKKGLMQQLFP